MRRLIPDLDLNTTPSYRQVSPSDDIVHPWTVPLPDGLTPATAVVTVFDHWAGVDVSNTIKSGSASVTAVSGSTCTVTQRLANWTRGKLYRAEVVVTATDGQDLADYSWFDCV